MNAREFARCIDYTLLRPDATDKDILKLCDEALEYGFASACVASGWAGLAKERLKDSGVKTCVVVGFPFGSGAWYGKVSETWAAVDAGAEEIDTVMNVGYLKSGRLEDIKRELSGIVAVAQGATVKVIIETCYLTDDEKVLASRIVKDSGADFVKTSTGYGPKGATVEDVQLIAREVPGIKIKASGGIRTFADAKKFLDAGASRIGTSSGPAIMKDFG
jgi:deoxyribose-phosphate aldolase